MSKERKQKPRRGSVTVKLNQAVRKVHGARLNGDPVTFKKYTDKGHLKVEITGLEIDGFGPGLDGKLPA